MLSIITRLVNKDWDEVVIFGSEAYVQTVLQTSQQVIEILWVEHTEEQREDFCSLSEDELYEVLTLMLKKNSLYVEKPN
jgi:hypothetical protein